MAAELTLAKGPRLRKIRRFIPLYIMIIPGALYLILNNYIPLFGMIIAFKDVNFAKGILASDWAGLKNFEYLFKTKDAFIITRNTLLYNAVFISLGVIIAVSTAILLNEVRVKIMARFYQTLILVPFLISMVIVGYLVYAMLSMENGFINEKILPLFGMKEIMWYSEPKYWPFILTIVNVWKTVGNSCIIYLAAIAGIDKEYYEAAKLDGANKWHQIWNITIPSITPVISILTLLAVGRIFYSDFGLFYQVPLNSGTLFPVTQVIDTYTYRALMTMGDIGMSSAAGVYQSIVGFILVFASNYIVRKRNSDNALF